MASKLENAIKALFMGLIYLAVYEAMQLFSVYVLGYIGAYSTGRKMTMEEFSSRHIIGNALTATLAAMIAAGAVYIMIGILREKSVLKALPFRFINTPTIVSAITAALALRLLVGVYTVYSQYVPSLAESLENAPDLTAALDSPLKILIGLFASLIAAPIFEEILFRGLIQGELMRAFPVPAAIVISSLIFAVAHGLLFQSVFTFFVGLALGYALYKTGSLLTGIVIHIIFNSSSTFQLFFEFLPTFVNIAIVVVAVVLLIISIRVLNRNS